MADEVGFVTMAGARATSTAPEIGTGMLGYAFMGKAHTNAYKQIPYMIYPPPAVPKLVAIAGRDEAAVKEAALRYGYEGYSTAVICDAIVQSSLEGRRIAIEY